MKEVIWNSSAKDILRELSGEAKKEFGLLILDLQRGVRLQMPSSRPMPILGKGCHELRVKDSDGIYRAFYYVKLLDKIIVFHIFQKKSEKTESIEIESGRRNLRELL